MNAICVLAATSEVTDFTQHVGVPLLIALIALAGTVGAAALSFALSRLAERQAVRREGYAEATRELVAWAEYPYRIRRRTSDDPTVLSALAERGHAHQEALRYRQSWIRSENRWVARVFGEVRSDLAAVLGPASTDAWAAKHIDKPDEMTLAGWGPQGIEDHIERFERAVAFRFGWRRIVAALGWHPRA